jgi:uncharacterized membrane protein
MDLAAILKSLEDTGIASGIRNSLYWFPFLESIHVIGLSLVFGTITIVDLRLLGFASTRRPFERVSSDLLKWTWIAFAIVAVTGALMFTTNARVYTSNTAFRIKLVLLALAGLNMMMFEFTAGRTIPRWDHDRTAPPVGRIAAALSILLWIAVIFAGRVVGFTTTGAQAKQAPAPAPGVNFDDFLSAGPPAAAPPPPAPVAPPSK